MQTMMDSLYIPLFYTHVWMYINIAHTKVTFSIHREVGTWMLQGELILQSKTHIYNFSIMQECMHESNAHKMKSVTTESCKAVFEIMNTVSTRMKVHVLNHICIYVFTWTIVKLLKYSIKKSYQVKRSQLCIGIL